MCDWERVKSSIVANKKKKKKIYLGPGSPNMDSLGKLFDAVHMGRLDSRALARFVY